MLHIAELLNSAANEKRLGMTNLIKWLSDRLGTKKGRVEEHQLRLESDDDAVKVVTMHFSKGLQYPVVFCPFLWYSLNMDDTVQFHDDGNQYKLTLDFGSSNIERHQLQQEQEQLAENMRLLYVALTRARNMCYFAWGRFSSFKSLQANASAAAYLFHMPEMTISANPVRALKARYDGLKDDVIRRRMQAVAGNSEGTIELLDLPGATSTGKRRAPTAVGVKLACRTMQRSIDRSERISSYSSLVSRVPHAEELPDYDTLEVREKPGDAIPETVELPPYGSFMAFPKGARTGTFIHDVLERLDFTTDDNSAITALAMERLQAYGLDPAWSPAIVDLIEQLTTLSLTTADGSFSLSQIPLSRRLNELEFYFPQKTISRELLQAVFSRHATSENETAFTARMQELSFAPYRGFMKGFIDLVFEHNGRFYIIDWKSNFLGSTLEAYQQTALLGVMADNLYFLQYHIYTVALHQYLRHRIADYRYDQHFGGVFYLFLRGIDRHRGSDFGVYRARPSQEMTHALSQILLESV
jgi:exodeoxyribonuclease V beta subunit